MKTGINRKYYELIILCFLAYMISYIGKLGYSTNIQNYIDSYGVTKLQAGYASSVFFFCYGAGQFINAMLCERMNSVKVVSFALLISSVITVAMFFLQNVIVISVLWGVNGLVLSTLWCNVVKITSQIKDRKYVNKSITWLAITLPVGTLCAYGVSALLTYLGVWKLYFILSGAIICSVGLFFYVFATRAQRDIIEYQASQVAQEKEESSVPTDTRSFWKFMALGIIPLFMCVVFSCVIRDGVQTWMPSFLTANYQMPTYFSILITLVIPLVCVFSVMLAKKLLSLFKDFFILTLIISAASCLLLVLFLFFGKTSVVMPIIVFGGLSLLTHVVSATFTAVFPIYYNKHIKSGQTAGILNCFAYVGSSISSFALGGVADGFGWDIFTWVLLGCAGVAMIFALVGYFIFLKKPQPVFESKKTKKQT